MVRTRPDAATEHTPARNSHVHRRDLAAASVTATANSIRKAESTTGEPVAAPGAAAAPIAAPAAKRPTRA